MTIRRKSHPAPARSQEGPDDRRARASLTIRRGVATLDVLLLIAGFELLEQSRERYRQRLTDGVVIRFQASSDQEQPGEPIGHDWVVAAGHEPLTSNKSHTR